MLKESSDQENEVNPLDSHYEKLKTDIVPLDKNSFEYEMIHRYVRNTHGTTHDQYKLEILDVFKVDREGERRRYNPFSKLHNRKLLWHGSRVTNFAGILSGGLKIAPPEAPSSGYMFGKGKLL
jgi:poly [ADP-ribose] polymerase